MRWRRPGRHPGDRARSARDSPSFRSGGRTPARASARTPVALRQPPPRQLERPAIVAHRTARGTPNRSELIPANVPNPSGTAATLEKPSSDAAGRGLAGTGRGRGARPRPRCLVAVVALIEEVVRRVWDKRL